MTFVLPDRTAGNSINRYRKNDGMWKNQIHKRMRGNEYEDCRIERGWLWHSPDAEKYRTDQGVCYTEKDFVEYLNTYVFPEEPSVLVQNLGWTKLGADMPAEYAAPACQRSPALPVFFDRLRRKWGSLPTFDACGRVIVARSGDPLRFPLHTSPSLRTFFGSLPRNTPRFPIFIFKLPDGYAAVDRTAAHL